jgi:hypothetical protein
MPPPPPPPLNTQTGLPNGTSSAPHSAKFAPEAWQDTFKTPQFAIPQNAKFTKEAWVETFQTPDWAIPQPAKETSPRRGSAATKRPKASIRKPPTVPNTAPGDAQPEGPRPKYQAFAEEATNGDADAMDIDNAEAVERPSPLKTTSDRTFKPGTPIKFSDSAQAEPSPPHGKKPTTADSALPNGVATASSSASGAQPTSGLNGLTGLRNVEPLAPSANGAGLGGLGDLQDTLPFPSKASNTHPTKPNSAQKLKYPKIPGAPQPPPVLNEASVKNYFTLMEIYVRHYIEYNRTMTSHFDGRNAELDNKLDKHFIGNRGETTNGIGLASYMRKMKEDQEILGTWKLAHEMHLQVMQKCEEVRNKTVKQYAFVE